MKKLLITDIDNTLYNWISWYTPAFFAMAEKTAEILNMPVDEVVAEYREFNYFYSNGEPNYSTIDLPSVKEKFKGKTALERKEIFEPAFAEFRRIRKEKLRLYPHVRQTLKMLTEQGIIIVGCSDASFENCHKRLEMLDILKYFSKLFLRKSTYMCEIKRLPEPKVPYREISGRFCKPSKELIPLICKDMGFLPKESIFVGDSLARDIGMANNCNVTNVWARYGTKIDAKTLERLSQVSFQSPQEKKRVERILQGASLEPTYTIDSFDEVLNVLNKENSGDK